MISPGKRADMNPIDFDQLAIGMPRMTYDPPSGGGTINPRLCFEACLQAVVAPG